MKIAASIYMVMEWVDGRLLRQILIEQKKMPIERAVHITLGRVRRARLHSQPGSGPPRPETGKHHGGSGMTT